MCLKNPCKTKLGFSDKSDLFPKILKILARKIVRKINKIK